MSYFLFYNVVFDFKDYKHLQPQGHGRKGIVTNVASQDERYPHGSQFLR